MREPDLAAPDPSLRRKHNRPTGEEVVDPLLGYGIECPLFGAAADPPGALLQGRSRQGAAQWNKRGGSVAELHDLASCCQRQTDVQHMLVRSGNGGREIRTRRQPPLVADRVDLDAGRHPSDQRGSERHRVGKNAGSSALRR